MIFIVGKFETRPDWTRRWPGLVERFTAATRAEPGNLWFDWARCLENPATYVLVAAFRDAEAAAAHVNRVPRRSPRPAGSRASAAANRHSRTGQCQTSSDLFHHQKAQDVTPREAKRRTHNLCAKKRGSVDSD
jgi:quinol monooxygenase YgiN